MTRPHALPTAPGRTATNSSNASNASTGTPLRRRLALSAFAAGVAGVWAGPAAAANPGAPATPEALQAALEKLLQRKPELVRDALQRLERQEVEARQRQQQLALQQQAPAILRLAGSTVLGNPAGDVTLVEFIDYRCGYCKSLSASIDTLLQQDKQLRVLVKHLPILGPESMAAAQLVLANGQSADGARLHRLLIGAPSLDSAALQAIAPGAAASSAQVAAARTGLAEVAALADRLGIQGTPAIVVGGQLFRGAISVAQLEAEIQVARRAHRQ